MTQLKKNVTLQDIQEIVDQIVEGFHPEKVILFGSRALGTQGAESDVDLLILMRTEEQPLHAAARIAAEVDHPFPLDIVVSSLSDFESSLKRKGVFATQVHATGIVLYEARDSGMDR